MKRGDLCYYGSDDCQRICIILARTRRAYRRNKANRYKVLLLGQVTWVWDINAQGQVVLKVTE